MSQFGARARTLFDRAFPERQIYHRSGGTVRYISLSPSKQVLIALGAVGIAGWCAYATVNVLMRGQIMSAQSEEMERLEQKYQRWLREARHREAAAQSMLEEKTAQFEATTAELERRHDTLKMLLEFAGGANMTGAARVVERDDARLLMQASIEEADPRQSREAASAYQVRQVSYRGGVDSRIARLEAEQVAFLAEAEEIALNRAEEIRGVLRMTGVGITRLVEENGVGGPEAPLPIADAMGEAPADDAFARRVQQVAARVAEARRLEAIAGATPLGPPVGVEARETSGFGYRIDPFTGRPSPHFGLDLAAFERAPVLATSPGTVSFAGLRSGYGYTVEIDHGHGFKTRYAHLRDIQVNRGERVAVGQRVGSMGSTGRSTGTHLHYEVWFRGKALDPVHFLRAGRYVHEQG